MALEIHCKHEGHVSYVNNFNKLDSEFYSNNLLKITADGDELTYILNRFSNIPMLKMDKDNPSDAARGYSMTWHGDIAKFIIANLV